MARTTDFRGVALLGAVPLPQGTYALSAHFAKTVTPPAPLSPIETQSQLYQASTVVGFLTISGAVPTARADVVVGRAGEPLKIAIADLISNDTDPDGGTLALSRFDAATGRGIPVTRSGAFLLLPELTTAGTTRMPSSTPSRILKETLPRRAPSFGCCPTTRLPPTCSGSRSPTGWCTCGSPAFPADVTGSSSASLDHAKMVHAGKRSRGAPVGDRRFDAPDVGTSGFYRTVNP